MTSPSDLTREFHQTFNAPIRTVPSMEVPDKRIRGKLITEEYIEVLKAFESGDIVNMSKELADLVYVIYGTAHAFGIPLDEVFEAVHESNMSKLDDNGEPILREDGKILKSTNYFPAEPAVQAILERSGLV